MYNSLNIDEIVGCVKTIFENSRCVICDKSEGARMRYPCGHTGCEDCVISVDDCLICLTPLQASAHEPKFDDVLTKRVANAASLFNTCQEAFNIDVYRRKRISEQLKVEKELFPDCIQAPLKYGNKRRSLNRSYKNKENKPTRFPGEEVSPFKKMENSVNYVHQWFNRNEKSLVRKPLTDLNSNDSRVKSKPVLLSTFTGKNIENKQKMNRKRSFKTANSIMKSQKTISDQSVVTIQYDKNKMKRMKEDCLAKEIDTGEKAKQYENESGIVIDDDVPIVIDDSQVTVDKDKNAWLAVLEAEKNQHDSASILQLGLNEMENTASERAIAETKNSLKVYKVPFIKKGYLSETCILCNNVQEGKIDSKFEDHSKGVSITIDNDSFKTIIKVSKIKQKSTERCGKHSTAVQTDVSELDKDNIENKLITHDNNLPQKSSIKVNGSAKLDVTSSEELFTDYREKLIEHDNSLNVKKSNLPYKPMDTTQGIVIEESDSDEEVEDSRVLEVTADVHRSCDEIDYGVLAVIENLEEHENRARRAARGLTPDSSNSSDKENYDPNRPKKDKYGKKDVCKKL